MTKRVRELLEKALALTVKQRAELAAELIASVDGDPDKDVQAAWAAEIERRAKRALAGGFEGDTWEVARDRIRRRLREE